EHFVDAGERRMPRLVPAACDRASVGQQSRPCGERGKANVRGKAGDAEGEIKRSCSGIENERCVEQIGVVEQIAALDHVQKCHEQQEGNAQSHHHDQRCTGSRWLLFGFCHSRHRRILHAGIHFPVSAATGASAPASTEIFSSDSICSTSLRKRRSNTSLFLLAVPPLQSFSWPPASR